MKLLLHISCIIASADQPRKETITINVDVDEFTLALSSTSPLLKE